MSTAPLKMCDLAHVLEAESGMYLIKVLSVSSEFPALSHRKENQGAVAVFADLFGLGSLR
jgi:hypothetical protein